jgi:hypothetical protein
MKGNEEILEEIKSLCDSIINLDQVKYKRPSDDHIELAQLIKNIMRNK